HLVSAWLRTHSRDLSTPSQSLRSLEVGRDDRAGNSVTSPGGYLPWPRDVRSAASLPAFLSPPDGSPSEPHFVVIGHSLLPRPAPGSSMKLATPGAAAWKIRWVAF